MFEEDRPWARFRTWATSSTFIGVRSSTEKVVRRALHLVWRALGSQNPADPQTRMWAFFTLVLFCTAVVVAWLLITVPGGHPNPLWGLVGGLLLGSYEGLKRTVEEWRRK